jgi:hypothetical protein
MSPVYSLLAIEPQLFLLCSKSFLAIEPQHLPLWFKSLLAFEPQFLPLLFQPFARGVNARLPFLPGQLACVTCRTILRDAYT